MRKMFVFVVFLWFTTSFSAPAWAERIAYVINNLGKTLSKINLTTNEVTNDIEALGEAPNQIVIHQGFAYVVNSLDHNIQIIDLGTENTVGYIDIGEPRNPFNMTFVDSRYAYVTNLMTSTISKVDVVDKSVVGEYGVGLAPEGLMVVGNKLYICCTGFEWFKYKSVTGRDWVVDPTHRSNDVKAYRYIQGRVYVFDLQAEAVVDSIAVGINPQYLDLDPGGELNVVCTGDYWSVFGQIYRINPATNMVIDSMATGGSPGMISIGADGVGFLAGGGWYPEPGKIYTFDSHADTMIRGSDDPITTDYGVISVTALYPSQVLSCNFDADDLTRLNSNGDHLNTYLLGDGPISVAIYASPPQTPLLDEKGIILTVIFLTFIGWLFLKRRG